MSDMEEFIKDLKKMLKKYSVEEVADEFIKQGVIKNMSRNELIQKLKKHAED